MPESTVLRRARRGVRDLLFGRWPRVGLAVRTAVAAGLAWQIALWLPFGPADHYPYYAPLGAVVGSFSTVRSSVRNSLLAVFGIVVGASLALTGAELLGSGVLTVVLVVLVATLLAGWRRFGGQSSWVLTSAVFVLIVGAADPVDYVLAYSGLTLLGGLVAVGVNALLPDLPLAQSDRALRELAGVLADQLSDLADGLQQDEPLRAEDWQARLWAIAPLRESMRTTGLQTEESLHGNVRARRHLDAVRRQHIAGVVLRNVATRVEELTDLLVEVQTPADRAVAMEDESLRWPTVAALKALAAVLQGWFAETEDWNPLLDRFRDEVLHLSSAQTAAQYDEDRDRQTAGAVVTALRRCLGALQVETDDDPEAVVPTPWVRPDPEAEVRPQGVPRSIASRLPLRRRGRERARRSEPR